MSNQEFRGKENGGSGKEHVFTGDDIMRFTKDGEQGLAKVQLKPQFGRTFTYDGKELGPVVTLSAEETERLFAMFPRRIATKAVDAMATRRPCNIVLRDGRKIFATITETGITMYGSNTGQIVTSENETIILDDIADITQP